MKKFGPHLGDEFVAAGLGGLPFAWNEDGQIFGRENLTEQQSQTIDWVMAAHDAFRPDLLAYAKQKRWEKEVGGLLVNGIRIATDDRSKVMLMGARSVAEADATSVQEWDSADGSVHQLTAPQIIAISQAVAAHVSQCFATYKVVKDKIDNGQITSKAKIDEAFV